jgi:hypothetical protein
MLGKEETWPTSNYEQQYNLDNPLAEFEILIHLQDQLLTDIYLFAFYLMADQMVQMKI